MNESVCTASQTPSKWEACLSVEASLSVIPSDRSLTDILVVGGKGYISSGIPIYNFIKGCAYKGCWIVLLVAFS